MTSIMKPKERIISAINHKVPDRIPLAIQEIEDEHIFAKYLGITDAAEPVHPDIGYYSESYEKLGIDCFRLEIGYDGDIPTGPGQEKLNEWGTVAKKDYGTDHWYPLAAAEDIQAIEQHPWPDPDMFDYEYAAQKARDKGKYYALRGPHWWPLLCRVFDLMGMESSMMKLALEPVIFEAVLDKVFEITYICTEKLIEACGDDMHIVCAGDDFADQKGMMLSPAIWRKYLKPRYQKLFELARKNNKYIWFHSCGNIYEVLPDLIDIGMDVWETVQLHTLPITPEKLKREFGNHITFFGAVNSQKLPFMDKNQVREETIKCIEALGENGGYICSADHGIRNDVPFENIKQLFDTARNFRTQGYTLETKKNVRDIL